jgi:hypothetical protein
MRVSKAGRILLGAGLAVMLTLAGTGIAAATSHGNPQPPGPVVQTSPKVTSDSLCRDLFAVVNADGSLARAGCPGTASTSLGTGVYQVSFPRDLSACGFVATVGLGTFGGTVPPSMITLAGRAGNTSAVFIETSNSAGTITSLPFHLSVQCPPAHRSGKVKILSGNTAASVPVPGGISSASVGLATVQTPNAGVAVQSATPNVAAGTLTIRLNKAPSTAVMVGWSVAD